MQTLFLLVLIMCGESAAEAPETTDQEVRRTAAHDVYYQGNLLPLNTMPTFDHGYLVAYDWEHRVSVYGPDGAMMYSVAVKLPGSNWGLVHNAAVDSDGTTAAAIQSVSAAGVGGSGGIALFDRTGAQIRLIDTGGYIPTQVAFGPDHSIWAIGGLGLVAGSETADYSILRNYAQDGKESGEFLRRASFPYDPTSGPLIDSILGRWELRVENERVEAILDQAHLWVETDLKGQEQSRWDLRRGGRPYAITQNGNAWRMVGHRLQIFDRSSGVWKAVAFDAPDGFLLRADGGNLAFLLQDLNTVRWVPAPGGSPAH